MDEEEEACVRQSCTCPPGARVLFADCFKSADAQKTFSLIKKAVGRNRENSTGGHLEEVNDVIAFNLLRAIDRL